MAGYLISQQIASLGDSTAQANQDEQPTGALVGRVMHDGSAAANVSVVVAEVPNANSNLLRQLIDQIRKAIAPSAIFLATTDGDSKVVLVAGVSRDVVDKLHAGNLVKQIAPLVGGGGGGVGGRAWAEKRRPSWRAR